PGSLLVRTLARDGEVFAYGYSQNAAIDAIVASGGLADGVRRLKEAGYKQIVLVGHSAGGMIVRQFIEDHPDARVTKAIQVCAPNGGTPTATVESFKAQRAFLDSLTLEGRRQCLKERSGKTIPRGIQFVCIVSNAAGDTDGIVRCDCQWSPDLQQQ